MAFWPALLLAREQRLRWALRGLLAGGAVLLALVALLSQSRGSLYATPVVAVLVFALLPGRVRTFALCVPVAAGIGAAAPIVLRVGDRLHNGSATHATVHDATTAILLVAVAVALAVALGAALETRLDAGAPALRARLGRGAAALAVLALLVGLGGGLGARRQSRHARRKRVAQLQGRLRTGLRRLQPARQRTRQQPLRLLPCRARRIPRAPHRGHRRGQLPAAVPAARPLQRDPALPAQRRAAHARPRPASSVR